MSRAVTAFAPATVANLGPGFDLLGVAVTGPGDRVSARWSERAGVHLEQIEGDGGLLPRDPERNTAAIAAREVLALTGETGRGVALRLVKGLPLGSGLGSSSASAAAAAWAVNLLLGRPLEREALLPAGLEAEAAVSGRHADNIAPALLGGIRLVRGVAPLEILALPVPADLWFALVTPDFELSTRRARRVVPRTVPMADHVANSGALAAMVAALCSGSAARLGAAMQDRIVEPARAPLIPGCDAVRDAARAAGAAGVVISGAGPTICAVTTSEASARAVAAVMQDAFRAAAALESRSRVAQVDGQGAREIVE